MREQARDLRIHGHVQRIAGERGCIQSTALAGGRDRKNLRGAERLPKSLILGKVEGPPAAVVETRQYHGSANGNSKLIALKRGNAPGIVRRPAIEIVAGVKGRIPNELEDRSVDLIGSRFGDDVSEAGSAVADVRRDRARI